MTNPGRTIPSCPTHPGHRLGACALCQNGGTFAPESTALRAIAAHRKRTPSHTTALDHANHVHNERVAAVRASALRVGKLRPVAKAAPPTRFVAFKGRRLSIPDWARAMRLDKTTVANRIARGIPLDAPRGIVASRTLVGTWSYAEDCAATPPSKPVVEKALPARALVITFRGVKRRLVEWAQVLPFNESTLRERYSQGVPLDAPKTPKGVRGPRGSWDYTRDCAVVLAPKAAPKAKPPHRPSPEITFRGVTRTRVEWAVHFGISTVCVRERALKGVPLDMPPHRGRAEIGPGRWDYARDVEIPRVVDVSKMEARRAKLEAELAVLREQIARAS